MVPGGGGEAATPVRPEARPRGARALLLARVARPPAGGDGRLRLAESSEGSARTPVRDPRAGEEQEEEAATLISADSAARPAEMSVQSPPASDISGCGTEATDPDDELRPVTKHEFTKFRHRVENTFQRMYADVMGLQQKEVEEQNRLREYRKMIMVGQTGQVHGGPKVRQVERLGHPG